MARAQITGRRMDRTVSVGGHSRAASPDRVHMTALVDGKPTTTKHAKATSQEAIYVATHKAIRKAHAEGITHLTLDSPNTVVRGHLQEGWRRTQIGLHQFQQDIEALIEEFDEVRWT